MTDGRVSNGHADLFSIDPADHKLLEQVIDPEYRDKWVESLAGMLDVGAAALRADGVGTDQAARHAGLMLHALAIYHGGHMFYLPRNEEVELAIRNRRIFHAWMSGQATPPELAKRYRVSEVRLYQILAEQRGLWQAKHAPQLPGLER